MKSFFLYTKFKQQSLQINFLHDVLKEPKMRNKPVSWTGYRIFNPLQYAILIINPYYTGGLRELGECQQLLLPSTAGRYSCNHHFCKLESVNNLKMCPAVHCIIKAVHSFQLMRSLRKVFTSVSVMPTFVLQ